MYIQGMAEFAGGGERAKGLALAPTSGIDRAVSSLRCGPHHPGRFRFPLLPRLIAGGLVSRIRGWFLF